MLERKRIVDLTRVLQPGAEPFKLDVRTFFVDELLPGFHRPKDEWYIMQEWQISSHIGTHVEAPYHHIKTGTDIAGLSIERLMGEAVVLDFRYKEAGEAIERSELQAKADDVRKGDIVIIHTGYAKDYGKPDYDRPYVSLESISWLVERGIACLGIDASGIEKYKAEHQPGHVMLFERGIPIIEELTNLEKVRERRVLFLALPIPVRTADASPVRAIAIEGV